MSPSPLTGSSQPNRGSFRQAYQTAYLQIKNRVGKRDRHVKLLQKYNIDVVLDVGGNEGQYAANLIKRGFTGKIVSFEPQPDAFEVLAANTWGLSQWTAEPFALGAEESVMTMNVAGNSQSSSLHPMLATHVDSAPESAYVAQVNVQVKRLDGLFSKYCRPGQRVFLKMDVQGHEHKVIEGASGCLDQITGMELELSMIPLYEDQLLWHEAIDSVREIGFVLARMTPGFSDPRTGVMLQADGIFMRQDAVEQLRAAA